ncbi:MAG: lytic transglycosylase domain-containing protein [Vampirovibrionia bacterium]
MSKSLFKYLIVGFICLFSSGCAASLSSNKPNTVNNLPPNVNQRNVIPDNYNLNDSSLDRLVNFILSYNKRLSGDQARAVADAILQASNKHMVNYRVVTAVVAIESGFRPDAKSPSGAMGLGQLMPMTARGLNVSDPFNPYDNLNGAVKLLRSHLEKYNGDINFALGAYKMGAGTVSRRGIGQQTTEDYVKRIRTVFDQVP